MTTPDERTRAMWYAERFLIDLANPSKTPRVPKDIRDSARMILRHFPSMSDIALVNNAWKEPLVKFVSDCPFEHPENCKVPFK